jgi:preprotein translocase subunit SecE
MEEKMAKATTGDSAPAKTPKVKAQKADKPGFFARPMQYFRDVRSEMKRVVWPQRPEVINSSIVVIVTLAFFIVFTLIVDTAVVQVIRLLTKMG